MSAGSAAMRVVASGSAALPVSTRERWREISGHTLLERYGMTKIGMALSNPLRGERRPGHVRLPLPGVEVRLGDEDGQPVESGESGEIELRGPDVFREYWRRPEATAAALLDGGWFRTGDVAVVDAGTKDPRAPKRRHPEDGRVQGLRAGDRGGASDPSGRRGSAQWWGWRMRRVVTGSV